METECVDCGLDRDHCVYSSIEGREFDALESDAELTRIREYWMRHNAKAREEIRERSMPRAQEILDSMEGF